MIELAREILSISAQATWCGLRRFDRARWLPDAPVGGAERVLGSQEDFCRGFVRWAVGAFEGDASDPADMARRVFELAARGPDVLRLALPGRTRVVLWTELRNKLQAFRLFATADRELNKGVADASALLARAAERAAEFSPYQGLWTTEGLGYHVTADALRRDPNPASLLMVDRLPSVSLVPLHTGMGMALAFHGLTEISRRAEGVEVRRALVRYLGLCRNNAREGYVGAAVESLGIITKVVRPRLVPVISDQLGWVAPDLTAKFWHGFGRGLYFSPSNVFPCGVPACSSLAKAVSEPPDDQARDNAVAGFAWAVTLVNLHNPEVLDLLLRFHGAEIPAPSAFADGVCSAAAVWHDWSPRSHELDLFCRYRPRRPDAQGQETWEQYARSPCDGRLRCRYDQLKRESRLGDLFEYRPGGG